MTEHPLRAYRRKADLSLEALAGSVGCAQSTLSRIETGQLEPSMGLLRRLVAATGLKSDDFVQHPKGRAA